eukprot:8926150-Ditylum_brightwellii.AAC.1
MADSDFHSLFYDFIGKCTDTEEEVFQSWVEGTIYAIKHGDVSLDISRKLIEVDKQGCLQVNFKESLVKMIQEEKKLSEL